MNHTSKAEAEKRYSSPVGIVFLFRRRGPASSSDLGGSTPAQSPYEPRFFLSHFLPRSTSSKPIGLARPKGLCYADVRFANAIPSSVTVAVASRRTMNITIGLESGAAFATVAGRPSPSFRRFLSLTPTTACWLAARRSGDTLRSTTPGKMRRPRSGTPIGCPILPPFAGSRAAWTASNQRLPFGAKPAPVWPIGWGTAIWPIHWLSRYRG